MNAFETALLHHLKPEQLAMIQKTRIGIGGAGGLGSNLAVILVRTGFRDLEIIDKDVVEASNLNRQGYTLANIGKPKTECLKQALLAINPDVRLTLHRTAWTPGNACNFFKGRGIIAEAFDTASCKLDFVEYYRTRAAYVVSGNGMAGLDMPTRLSTRKIGNVIVIGDGATDTADGYPVLAPRVIECAAKMADAAILRLSLSHTPPDLSRRSQPRTSSTNH